jgi:hypothetical protein
LFGDGAAATGCEGAAGVTTEKAGTSGDSET